MQDKLHLRYVYTYYSLDEAVLDDALDQIIEISDTPCRFTLNQQEEGSFTVSEIRENHLGKFVVVTYPTKESLIALLGEDYELEYDEFYGDIDEGNHNVYQGTLTLEEL